MSIISGLIPGYILINATLSARLVFRDSSFSFLLVYFTCVSFIVTLLFSILASGFIFILVNVSRRDVCILRALVPLCRSQ